MPMASATVRINPEDHSTLRDLSRRMKEPMSSVMHRAIENLRRDFFLESTRSAYAMLRRSEECWSEELQEREEWDVTLADGDEDDP